MRGFGNYVRYNESLYRTGFRPYGLTNPRGATQLGAIPQVDHGWGGFGPWELHGYPFSAEGGWALHGLGGIVPDGSIVTYQGKWAPTGTMGAQDVVSAVVAALQNDGALAVRNVQQNSSWLQNTPPFPLDVGTFDVTLTLQVKNGMGFGDPNDIAKIVQHYVYAITGAFPVADTIPNVQVPSGAGTPGATGQPQLPGATGQPQLPGAPGTPTDWSSWISNNFGTIALAVGALAILPPLLKRVF
jgi:hypothetical protein